MSLAKYAAPLVDQREKGWGQNKPDPNYKPYDVGVNQKFLPNNNNGNLNANRTPPLKEETDVRARNAKHPIFFRTQGSLDHERKYRSMLNPPLLEAQEYNLYQDNQLKPNNARLQAFSGIHEATELNQTFMSQQNMDLVQDRIRYDVYKRSNGEYVIDRQDDLNLQIIMRSIYLQYSRNELNNVKRQIEELNDLVLQETVPKIMSQIEGYKYYLVDASQNPVPLAHPENLNSAGRKTLPSVTRTFFSY